MALSSIVASKINQNLAEQTKRQEQEENSVERTLNQKVSDTQRVYTQEVERAIESQVNLSAFLERKSTTFGQGAKLEETINTLYEDMLPELLRTSYAKDQLAAFFAGVSKDTTITVTGSHSDLLISLIKDAAPHASVATTSGDSLGSITYTVDQTVWEFSLGDFLNDVQSKTLSHVLALI